MILTANQFVYNGHPSYLYGLRFMWLNETEQSQLSGSKEYSYFSDRSSNTFSIKDSYYKEPLSFNIEMFSDKVLSEPEVRRIYSLYFNLAQFKELRLIDDEGNTTILNCIFKDPQRYEYGMGSESGVVGFRATMVLETPFVSEGYKRVVLSEQNGWNLYNESDSHEYIYPEVSIILPQIGSFEGNNATFSIINSSDAVYSENAISSLRPITITKPKSTASEEITFLPKLGKITDSTGATVLSRTNKKFIRLVPGVNKFNVSCDTTISGTTPQITSITLSYREDKVIV